MRQAYNKHCLVYFKTLVNVKQYFLTCNAILPFGKENIFKISFPLFPSVGNGHSIFLPLSPLFYGTTYHVASIRCARAPSIPHTATKAVIASV